MNACWNLATTKDKVWARKYWTCCNAKHRRIKLQCQLHVELKWNWNPDLNVCAVWQEYYEDSVENFQFPIKHTKWLGFLYTNHVALLQLSLAFPLTLLLSKKYIYTVKSQAVACFGYSRVWNKRSPLNKHSPWKICLKE